MRLEGCGPDVAASTLASPFETPCCAGLLVLANWVIDERSERNGPLRVAARSGPPIVGSSAPEPCGLSLSKIAVGFFIGPGWLKEPGVRITRKGRRR